MRVIEQRVHLHGGVPAKLAQGNKVQRVETLIEIHADRIAGVRPRDAMERETLPRAERQTKKLIPARKAVRTRRQ